MASSAAMPPIRRPVLINSAPLEEIDGLYGIGPALAERIVAHREERGPFRGPDDLAEVDGMGAELAFVLAPHIDWSPSAEHETTREKREWFGLVVGGLLASLLFFTARSWISFTESSGGWDSWTALQLAGLVVGLFVVIAAGSLEWVTTSTRHKAIYRRVLRGTWLTLFLGGSAGGLAGTINLVSIYLDGHRTAQVLHVIVALIGSTAWCFLSALVLVPPSALLSVSVLDKGTNLALLVMSMTLPFAVTMDYLELPILMRVSNVFGAVMTLAAGLFVIRGGSVYHWYHSEFAPIPIPAEPHSDWRRWINEKLPDPEQQVALLAELRRMQPTSRWRTVSGYIVISVGGWLLVTSVGAVLEWVIQNLLDASFGRGAP